MLKIAPKTSEKNLIEMIGKINDLSKKRRIQLGNIDSYKQTKVYRNVIDRIYCLILVNGLKKSAVKSIDDSKLLNFP